MSDILQKIKNQVKYTFKGESGIDGLLTY